MGVAASRYTLEKGAYRLEGWRAGKSKENPRSKGDLLRENQQTRTGVVWEFVVPSIRQRSKKTGKEFEGMTA